MIRLDIKHCNREHNFSTKEITSLPINGEEVPFVGVKDGREVKIKFVVRGLTTQELRHVKKFDGRQVTRRRLRIDSQGREWHDTKGNPIYDIETYTERDPLEPEKEVVISLIGLGGKIDGTPVSDSANKETGCGWYVDGEKQVVNIDIYEGWAWEQAPLLRLAIFKAVMELTFVSEEEENLSDEASDSMRSESE